MRGAGWASPRPHPTFRTRGQLEMLVMRLRFQSSAIVVALALLAGTASVGTAPKLKRLPNDDQAITHVLNRIGFGPAPGDVRRVSQMGLERYIEQQLHPEKQ